MSLRRLASILALFLQSQILAGASVRAQEVIREGDATSVGSLVAEILPVIEEHCFDCHQGEDAEAALDLSSFQSVDDILRDHDRWRQVAERVAAGEMPPPDATAASARERLVGLASRVEQLLRIEARKHAGDPGVVLARRLNQSEYDYVLRTLTSVPISVTDDFPIDPSNEAGFDNSGESLAMSPALLGKYLAAARRVAEHMVLTPRGMQFAQHPVVTDTDRDKYCVRRIVDFYQAQNTDFADFFLACWLAKQEPVAGVSKEEQLTQIAARLGLSPRYLVILWGALRDPVDWGPLARIQDQFDSWSVETPADDVRAKCEELADYVRHARKYFEPQVNDLVVEGVHKGTQAFVLWKNDQYANARQGASFERYDQLCRRLALHTLSEEEEIEGDDEEMRQWISTLNWSVDPKDDADCRRDAAAFCSVFPDAFYVSERGRDYLGKAKEDQEKGRLLSAGFHSMMGYYRDDRPLVELLLSAEQSRQLDALWEDLDFVTSAPIRQYQGFLWFDRTDSRFMRDPIFDFARPEDLGALAEDKISRLSHVYFEKAQNSGATEVPLQAIADYFEKINRQIRWVEKTRVNSERVHVDAVIKFAQQAYRRPLKPSERQRIRKDYRELRQAEELTHEEAIQDLLVATLVSPNFLYRWDLLCDSDAPRALDNGELANRLSFFLWSDAPDEKLRRLADEGHLTDPGVLAEEAKRMMSDDRIKAWATEFGGNWLGFRQFQQHNSVDRERFPDFNDQLRQSMFDEPITFLADAMRCNGKLFELLSTSGTWVNSSLARHYNIDTGDTPEDEQRWWYVEDVTKAGRGGLLPMGVFLTMNAPGLRTSPVKRGYWVVRRLLGESIPPPPPDVPDLPDEEAKLDGVPLRDVLAMHRAHTSCAGCHNRFDAIGVTFENYGPVGELRTTDLGGLPVETATDYPDGITRSSIGELKDYLVEVRGEEFVDNFCRKLLSYGLGRSLLLTDEPLLESMKDKLAESGYRLQDLVIEIVSSPQFLTKRGAKRSVLASSN